MKRLIIYVTFLSLTVFMATYLSGCSSIKGTSGKTSEKQAGYTPLQDSADKQIECTNIKELVNEPIVSSFHDTLFIGQNDLSSEPIRTINISRLISILAAQTKNSAGNGNSIVYIHYPYMDNQVVKAFQSGYYNSTLVDFNYNYWNSIAFDQDGISNNLESVFYSDYNHANFHQFGIYNSISSKQHRNNSLNVSQNGNNNSVTTIQH